MEMKDYYFSHFIERKKLSFQLFLNLVMYVFPTYIIWPKTIFEKIYQCYARGNLQ